MPVSTGRNANSSMINSKKVLKKQLYRLGRTPSSSSVDHLWDKYGPFVSDALLRNILDECQDITDSQLKDALTNVLSRYSSELLPSNLAEIPAYGSKGMQSEEISEVLSTFDPTQNQLRLSKEEILQSVRIARNQCLQFHQTAGNFLGDHGSDDLSRLTGSLVRHPQELFRTSSRGAMIVQNGVLFGTIFELVVQNETELQLEIQLISANSLSSRKSGSLFSDSVDPELHDIDADIFLFRNVDDGQQKRLVGFSSSTDRERKFSFRKKVSSGTFTIVPFTTGAWIQQPVTEQSNLERKLIIRNNRRFQRLSEEYTMMDLDQDDLLSRTEFECFAKHATGDTVTDEDWSTISKTFSVLDGMLTRQGFLQMITMEAENCEDDDELDLWIMLEAMGFNSDLENDKAFIFNIQVTSSNCETLLIPTDIKQCNMLAEKAICCAALVHGVSEELGSEIVLYELRGDSRISFVIENRGRFLRRVECSLFSMQNCITNREYPFEVSIQPKKTVVLSHFVPVDSEKEWTVSTNHVVKL